jgi:hypothetical protein
VASNKGVYVVSKVHRAEHWRNLLGLGFPIISTWINDGLEPDIDFSEAWPRYLSEASSAAVVLVWVDEGETLKGGLLEIGAALSHGVPVVVIGEVPQLRTAVFHDLVFEVNDFEEGFRLCDGFLKQTAPAQTLTIQQLIGDWVLRCFGELSFKNGSERSRRVLEEAIELAQACDLPLEKVIELAHYVYGRPVGEVPQELAGLSMTLLALAESYGLDLAQIQKAEIERVLSLPVEHFKKRLALKVAAGVAIGPVE